MSTPKVLLSTTSVYPEASTSAFELAAALGYDGLELMVGVDSLSTDVDGIEKLANYHGVKVLSLHAPTLLVTQGTWGTDAWDKLRRSGEAIARLGIQCGRQGCSLVLREHAARIETERKEYEAAVIRGAASWLDSLWAEAED